MKYGESTFDIIYLLFAVIIGMIILISDKSRASKTKKLMGSAILILGLGDAFHLVPRVLNYFVDHDFTMWLGAGKLVTSVTMTVFYVLMYHIYNNVFSQKNIINGTVIYTLAIIRIILCLLPQNGWLENDSSVIWGVIRNIPFVMIGAIIVCLFFQSRREDERLKYIWLWVTLSFLFYIPVAVAAPIVPVLGMLMLPKTVCYMMMVWTFFRYD